MSSDVTSKRADRLRRRHRAERQFRLFGVAAVVTALCVLVGLLGSITFQAWSGFFETQIRLEIMLDPSVLDADGRRDPVALGAADYPRLIREAVGRRFPEVTSREERRELYGLIASGAAFAVRDLILADPAAIGQTRVLWLPASDDADSVHKGLIDLTVPESDRRFSDRQLAWLQALEADGAVRTRLSRTFFTAGDSREPEEAGIRGALVGSALTLMVTLFLSFPVGVLAAVYLEEFAPRNRLTDLIELSVNNLAAVPSVIFGLLGLAVFLNALGLPRSAPIVGGMVLALMTLRTVVIAGRAALRAVPPSIRQAALAMGASQVQTVMHHVLPLAMPGILTGTIIGMAQALGETAPLLMIGMVAFIVDVPSGILEPATVLPVQVYLWADSPERAFVGKTAAAIVVLLFFLVTMNAAAVFLRKHFERRW
jgi:phosphate transport system permease protein